MNVNNIVNFMGDVENYNPKLKSIVEHYQKIIILGNGGSNSIASHISEDYCKVLRKRAMSFSDPAMLTCFINDYGQDNAYVEYLKLFSDKDTLVILISSSGKSKNIVNSLEYCERNKIPFITLTGFESTNKLNSSDKALLNFHIKSTDYGEVECVHQIFLHSII